ncbi:transferase hexapeptide repeat containing protein [Pseudopedobacter saltans DSM 12145]|uniref:Transferase hexapeptide repeat containing protein n=1 Tax=Pseudopedobacter saltans (strain ATCC 51119 / DSM 12145 / JCM 21818 / CCUG 39354 / LMG 10337 / NBRC 100064 / NCIMB 13643) TaxID=762903 RepID=F0SBD1_PSESL|nr:acyltransferase [Pseudopedobacter saltans]ADY53758.1 transferase hexapeptide repeat containing protein [Pseudopedobacter saltans DSM 12145]
MSLDNQCYIHETAVVDKGASIGKGTKIWHFVHVCSTAVIGRNCTIGQNVFIGENVVIGDGVKIQNNVSVYEGVILKDNVFIGPSVVFTNVINPRAFINRKDEFKKTIICEGVSIGANSTIVCGNSIGEYAFIGAGSVLTKNVGPYELWYGNPAEYRRKVNKEGELL